MLRACNSELEEILCEKGTSYHTSLEADHLLSLGINIATEIKVVKLSMSMKLTNIACSHELA